MRKLVNDPRSIVREMLEGQVALNAGQTLLDGENVVLRAGWDPLAARQVAVISGGAVDALKFDVGHASRTDREAGGDERH